MEAGGTEAAAAAGGAGLLMVVYLAVMIFMLVAMWKVFTKAGKPGWAVIVPIYNIIVMLEIAGKPLWWIILMFIPIVNFVIAILVMAGMAKNFGKGAGFVVGLLFLPIIFYPILGFGSATYSPVEG
jgi:hypothetical protein